MPTKIEWTEETWNPITGCTKISEGCQNCYAERMSKRLAGRFGYPADDPFKPGVLHEDKLHEPLKWGRPRKVFVCSMGDLFHENVGYHRIMTGINAIHHATQHTYIFLTKRPDIMLDFTKTVDWRWPSNCWLGVTAENQKAADERIPILLQIPAAVRFVSVEPMLGPVDLNLCYECQAEPDKCYEHNKLDWVICGGETGPGARPMHVDWARSLRDQCQLAKVPYFFKTWGDWVPYAKLDPLKKQGIKFGAGYCKDWIVEEEGEYQRAYCEQQPGKYAWNWYVREIVRWGDGYCSGLVGKHVAGRLLDGREWNEYPEVNQ